MPLHDPANGRADPADSHAEQARLSQCIECHELVDRREIQSDRRCESCHQRLFARVVHQEKPAPRPWWKRIRS
jgi:DNA-directed RNA polymerase subunit RPC12/RpoP